MSIPRWDGPGKPCADGDEGAFVLYSDHVAAVAEAEQRGYLNGYREGRGFDLGDPSKKRDYDMGYEQGQRDERERIRKAVEVLPKMNINAGIITQPPPLYVLNREQVIAVIDKEA